jgi:hypothetical protein
MALDLHASAFYLSIPAVAMSGILGSVTYNDKILLAEQHYGQTCDENNLFDPREKYTRTQDGYMYPVSKVLSNMLADLNRILQQIRNRNRAESVIS